MGQIDGQKLEQAVAVGDLEAVMMHLATQLDTAANKRYSLVLFQYNSNSQIDSSFESGSSADYSSMYSMLELYEKKMDPKFARNVQSIVVVHPNYSVKIAFRFFAPFLSDTMQSKLVFASSLVQLEQLVEFQLLRIPLFAVSCAAAAPQTVTAVCLQLEREEQTLYQLDLEPQTAARDYMQPGTRVTQVLAAANDSEFEEYVCAASSVLQDNWREFVRKGGVEAEAEEEIRAALAAFDLDGQGIIAADDLRYALGALGNYPMTGEELDELIALGGGGSQIKYAQLSNKWLQHAN